MERLFREIDDYLKEQRLQKKEDFVPNIKWDNKISFTDWMFIVSFASMLLVTVASLGIGVYQESRPLKAKIEHYERLAGQDCSLVVVKAWNETCESNKQFYLQEAEKLKVLLTPTLTPTLDYKR